MKKLIKIETPALKGVFTKWIKKELKKRCEKEEINLRDSLQFCLYNDDNGDYSIDYGMHKKYANCTCDYVCGSDPFHEGGLYVDNFMFGNSFNLNKYTTDRQFTQAAHRIIGEYNHQIELYESIEPERLVIN